MPENDITELQTLDIYQLTEEQYNDLVSSSELDPNAIYMTPAGEEAFIYWGDDVSSAPVPLNADQLQGYSLSALLSLIYPVGAIYQNTTNVNPGTFITGTTWQLISSVALASENVVGNGKGLGLTNGTTNSALFANGANTYSYLNALGENVGTGHSSDSADSTKKILGVPTKTQLGANPDYSGLIADTITVYMWERTV